MPVGFFSLILHAHLPFVRHPEYPEFLEEDWLYEAITEVYLPLLFILRNLRDAKAAPRLAINISPPLCEMLADDLLAERYSNHLANLFSLAEKELRRGATDAPEFAEAAKMYVEILSAATELWEYHYRRNLIAAFRELQDDGILEIITCGATHGFLPLISTREARRAQIAIATENYLKHFGSSPRGIWLPECAYEPGVEDLLKEFGIEYFIADSHAILYGDPRPKYGVYSPVVCPNTVAVFARDVETSRQVWSAQIGYPGNSLYREFYRDIGWDAPLEYLKPHLHKDGTRRHLGLKFHRITGKSVPQQLKEPYIPAAARDQAARDAEHFLGARIQQAKNLREILGGRPPLIVSPYDAELFGHWWFEGPQFLDFFFRKLHYDQVEISALSPGDFLDIGLPIQVQQPSASSWGENGYYKVWLNERNAWMYPYQHDAERRMTNAANAVAQRKRNNQTVRILAQMARELLLAESSDWAFQIYQGTTVEYSTRRFKSHIHRFNLLSGLLEKARLSDEDAALIEEIESRDNIFPEINPFIYCGRQ